MRVGDDDEPHTGRGARIHASRHCGLVPDRRAGSVDASHLQVLNSSRIELSAVGGDDQGVVDLIRSGQLSEYFKADAALTTAKPLSYTVRNLADNVRGRHPGNATSATAKESPRPPRLRGTTHISAPLVTPLITMNLAARLSAGINTNGRAPCSTQLHGRCEGPRLRTWPSCRLRRWRRQGA